MLLHAWRLAFTHPVDGRRMAVEAPLDAEFVKALAALGWTTALAS
jgi:tRNA pseudouridine65 synthase